MARMGATLFLLVSLVRGGLGGCGAQAQTVFTVNAIGDGEDVNLGDGSCATGAQTPGGAPECTFRAALQEANQDPVQDTLRFDTLPRNRNGVGIITPKSPLEVTQSVLVDGSTAPSDDVTREGDLRQRIATIKQDLPGAGSEGFELPTSDELDAWSALLEHILDGEIQAARSIIEQQFPSYTLVRFYDTATEQPYWLLHEAPAVERGWGVAVVNPTPSRNLAVEVPHPVFDLDTHTQGADLFRFVGARMLLMAGTHRCANSAASSCDGKTGVCGEYEAYRVSDMAHFVEAPFQKGHRTLTQRFPDVTVLNLHGNGNGSCETVFLSDGVDSTSPSLIQDLQSSLNSRGVDVGTPQTSTCPLEGTTNVQGRYTNGSSTPCTAPASATTGTFVHVEQRRGFREDPDEYQALIEAVNAVVPEMGSLTGRTVPEKTKAKRAEVSSEAPVIGIDGSDLSVGGHGVMIDDTEAAGTEIRGISVFNAPASGVWGRAPGLTVQNCYVGLRPTGEVGANGQHSGGGQSGAVDLEGPEFSVRKNVVSGNASVGIVAVGQQGTFRDNIVGADPALQTVLPNTGTGLVVGGKETSVRSSILLGNGGHGMRVVQEGGVQVGYDYATDLPQDPASPGEGTGNVLAQNDSSGALLTTGTGTVLRGNRIYENAGDGIRMGDTYDGNDDGDTDEGINRGQNVPLVESTSGCDDGGTETTVEVQYRVRSTADSSTASHYGPDGLRVDFYAASDGQQGRTYLGTDSYPAEKARQVVTTELNGKDVACTDSLVATATDADGNTSQFSTPNILPVELATFEGRQKEKGTAVLTWTTAAETNNVGFRVERETATGAWAEVGRVEGGGTRADGRSYRLSVSELGPGLHRFRLQQVDLDGSVTTYGPIGVRLRMEQGLQLSTPSPNPTSEQATVSFAVKAAEEAKVAIYNALGQEVRTLHKGSVPSGARQHLTYAVDDLSSGTYFLRLSAGEKTRTQRFTVVH